MKNLIKIKIYEDDHYILKTLYRLHINIYDVERSKLANIYTIDESDFDRVPFEVEIVSHQGYKNLLLKLKQNRHFIISIFLSILLIILTSHIIVKVEVIHNDKQIRELVTDKLDKYGIHPLMIKKSFQDLQKIKTNIKDNYPENIEWLEIIDNGMNYIVRIEERIITKPKEKPNYCDIVSTRDALVISSKVSAGQEVALPNDYVKKGGTIISGAINFNNETKSYVCAEAEVYGNTWYTVNLSMPYEHTIKNYTGNTHTNFAFEYETKRTSLFKVHFSNYDTKRKKIFSIGKFTLYKENDIEYIATKKKYSEEEIKEQAIKLGRQKILSNLDDFAEIIFEKVLQSNKYDSIIEMEIFYSVKELISETLEKEIPEKGVEPNEPTTRILYNDE